MQFRRTLSAGRAWMAIVTGLVAAAIVQAGSGSASSVHISNFGQIDNTYYRGAQPSGSDYKDLAAMGIKTVIDLEVSGDKDESGMVANAGMKFYRISMSDRARPEVGAVDQFLQVVNDPANQPVFVHCHGGRHRTGAMTAVYRMTHNGWNADQAYKEMKQYDFTVFGGHGVLKDYVYDYYSHLDHDKIGSANKLTSGDLESR